MKNADASEKLNHIGESFRIQKLQKAKLIKESPIDFRFCRIKPFLASKKINIS
jgi:hypothetical protein